MGCRPSSMGDIQRIRSRYMTRSQSASRLVHSSSQRGGQQQEAWGGQGGGNQEEAVVVRRVVRREDKYRTVTVEQGAVLHSVQASPLSLGSPPEEEAEAVRQEVEEKRRRKRPRLRRRKTSGVGVLDSLEVGIHSVELDEDGHISTCSSKGSVPSGGSQQTEGAPQPILIKYSRRFAHELPLKDRHMLPSPKVGATAVDFSPEATLFVYGSDSAPADFSRPALAGLAEAEQQQQSSSSSYGSGTVHMQRISSFLERPSRPHQRMRSFELDSVSPQQVLQLLRSLPHQPEDSQ